MGMAILEQNYSLSIKYPISDTGQYHLLQRKTRKTSPKAAQVQQLAYALRHDGLCLYKSWEQINQEGIFWALYLPAELPFFSGILLNEASKYLDVKAGLLFMCLKVFWDGQFYHINLLISPVANTMKLNPVEETKSNWLRTQNLYHLHRSI